MLRVLLRSATAASATAITLILLLTPAAQAQSWSSAITSGYTSVTSTFIDGTYTWRLTNMSSLAGDMDSDFDVLVWELIPFQVREPLSWKAPEGWTWAGDRWRVAGSPSMKYYTPGALGPGQTIEFQYTPNPSGAMLNSKGPQPSGLGFIAHIAAVLSGSGSSDGSRPWKPAWTEYGSTWFDRASTTCGETVPEPTGFVAMLAGLLSIGCRMMSRRR